MCVSNLTASLGTRIINEVLQLSSFIQFSNLIDLLMINVLMLISISEKEGMIERERDLRVCIWLNCKAVTSDRWADAASPL